MALNHETAGSTPARSAQGPIVYRLGSLPSSSGTGFDSPWGYCGVEELGRPQRFHKPKIMGSNPISATRSGVVQRQDVALLRQLSGFESLRRSLDSLLEGEGSFMPGPPSYPNSPIIAVQMTDEDVVVRVAQAFGVTYVPSAIRSAKWRRTYHARLPGESAVRLMQALPPWMGKRRQAQIDQAVASWHPQVRKVLPADERRILQLVAEERSYRAIGRETGFSCTTIGNVVARKRGVLAQKGGAPGRQPGGHGFKSRRSAMLSW